MVIRSSASSSSTSKEMATIIDQRMKIQELQKTIDDLRVAASGQKASAPTLAITTVSGPCLLGASCAAFIINTQHTATTTSQFFLAFHIHPHLSSRISYKAYATNIEPYCVLRLAWYILSDTTRMKNCDFREAEWLGLESSSGGSGMCTSSPVMLFLV